MKKSKRFSSKIAIAACACIILTSGIVFAKDIAKKLFSNTSPAIEKAVEEGYVQTVEKDFVYDKDIGVKIDNIVLDEFSLNISIKFKSENEAVKSIRFNKFVIFTDTGEKIFDNDQKHVNSLDEVYTAEHMGWWHEPQKIGDNIFSDSILFTLGERSKEKKELIFKIESLDVTYNDNTKEEVNGFWNFEIEITEEMRKSQSIKYKWKGSNEYLESCFATLSPTYLKVEYNLKESFDIEKARKELENLPAEEWIGPTFFFLKYNGKFYEAIQFSSANYENKKFILDYDNMSSLVDKPEKLELYLQPFDLTIFLERDT